MDTTFDHGGGATLGRCGDGGEGAAHLARPIRRRTVLGLIGTGFATAGWPAPVRVGDHEPPLLGTPDQIAAERLVLQLARDPRLARFKAGVRAELARGAIGRTADGAATLDMALEQWTNALLLSEVAKHRRRPVFLWITDDTPRNWFGHTLGGVGQSGDNPDAIYRSAMIDGNGQYVVTGRIDPHRPAAQLVLQVDHADGTNPASMMDMNSKQPSIVSATLGLFTDRTLGIAPDGSFRLLLGGPETGPNHVALKPGPVGVSTRDLLADWRQRPSRLSIRRIDAPGPGEAPEQLDHEAILRNALADLPGFVRFWGKFPEVWFGGLRPNSISPPRGRNGGWGFVAGLRFDLKPGEAVLVRTVRGGAAYTGFQLNNPWMIAPDARHRQASLNLTQAMPDADGGFTYVIAPDDPGVANWLDTAGLHSGIGILRWQALPPEAGPDGLVRDFRVVRGTDIAALTGVPRLSAAERRVRLAARAGGYARRTT